MAAYHKAYAQLELILCPCHETEFENEELPSDQIADFARKYGLNDGDRVTILAKGKTNGADAAPIWQFIKGVLPGDLEWNFSAWCLFDGNGDAVGRWGFSLSDIGNASFMSQVSAALAGL